MLVLGLWVCLVPYLGVPGSWRTVLLVLSGAAIAIIGFLLRGEAMAKGPTAHTLRGSHSNRSFVEHIPEIVEYAPDERHDGINSLN